MSYADKLDALKGATPALRDRLPLDSESWALGIPDAPPKPSKFDGREAA